MSEFDPTALDTELPTPPVEDELTALKERADQLGVTYHPSIGLEKLRTKVNDVVNGKVPAPVEEEKVAAAPSAIPKLAELVTAAGLLDATGVSASAAPAPVELALVETEGMKRMRLKREALKLVRVRVSCMNPAKKEWDGEIFTVGNAGIGTVKKFVPFNIDEGYHIPQIMLTMIRDRQCQVFVNKKSGGVGANKVTVREGKLIKEFAVEILDPLTPEELKDLAQRQAMSGAIV